MGPADAVKASGEKISCLQVGTGEEKWAEKSNPRGSRQKRGDQAGGNILVSGGRTRGR